MVKFASRIKEKNKSGNSYSCVYCGDKESMSMLYDELYPQSYHEGNKIESVRIYQESPEIWCCEVRCSSGSGGFAGSEAPNTVYGKASAQLRGSMLSVDLAAMAGYEMRWDHYLVAAPDADKVPDWWESATSALLSTEDAQKYAWIKNLSEMPQDSRGRWRAVKDPIMPGVQSVDVATYSITIVTKFSSAAAAGKCVANTLNKIGAPGETFSISGGDWKCDDATVSYDGSAWFATCTWTRSGDDRGWNKTLYESLD